MKKIMLWEKRCENCKYYIVTECSSYCEQAYERVGNPQIRVWYEYASVFKSRKLDNLCGPTAAWFKPTLGYRILRMLGVKP